MSKNRAHWPRGTGSPAKGVVRMSCRACGEAAFSKNREHRPWQTGISAQGVVRVSCRACREAAVSKNRSHRPGRTGIPTQEVVGLSCRGYTEAAVSRNREHWPGLTRSPAQGGVRVSGCACLQAPGTPAWGVRESSLGGGPNVLKGLWGVIFVWEPGGLAMRGGESFPGGGGNVL